MRTKRVAFQPTAGGGERRDRRFPSRGGDLRPSVCVEGRVTMLTGGGGFCVSAATHHAEGGGGFEEEAGGGAGGEEEDHQQPRAAAEARRDGARSVGDGGPAVRRVPRGLAPPSGGRPLHATRTGPVVHGQLHAARTYPAVHGQLHAARTVPTGPAVQRPLHADFTGPMVHGPPHTVRTRARDTSMCPLPDCGRGQAANQRTAIRMSFLFVKPASVIGEPLTAGGWTDHQPRMRSALDHSRDDTPHVQCAE